MHVHTCTCATWHTHTHLCDMSLHMCAMTTSHAYYRIHTCSVRRYASRMCARTHTFVRPYSFTCGPLLSHMQTQSVLLCITSHVYTHTHTHTNICNMTFSYVCHDSFTCIHPYTICIYAYAHTLYVCMCAMTASHPYILIHICIRTYSIHTHAAYLATGHTEINVRHDSFTCVTRLPHICIRAYSIFPRNMCTHRYLRGMTLSHVWLDCCSCTCSLRRYASCVHTHRHMCAHAQTHVCDLTLSHVWHDCPIRICTQFMLLRTMYIETYVQIFHMCDMTASYAFAHSLCCYAPHFYVATLYVATYHGDCVSLCTQRHMCAHIRWCYGVATSLL